MVARLLTLSVLMVGCARKDVRQEPTFDSTAVLYISGDIRGYLAPCGCSENMRGGIARAAFQVAEARKAGRPVVYLDAGEALFGAAQLTEAEVAQEERKARALAEVFKLMGLASQAVGVRDDARGAAFRRALGLPSQEGESVRTVAAGPRTIGVVTATSGPKLVELTAQARTQGADFIVGLLAQPLEEAQQAAGLAGLEADLIVAARARDELAGEDNRLVRTAVPVVQLQSKGRSLLRLDLTFAGSRGARFQLLKGQADLERELAAHEARIELLRTQVNEPSLKPEAKRLRQQKLAEVIARKESLAATTLPSAGGHNAFAARFVPLESTFPSLPEASAIVAAYDQDVGRLNLEWAKTHGQDCPPPAPKQPAFVGSGSCQRCHPQAFPVWSASKHAHAYETLERVGKNFHLNCVRCHVTGYQSPGGVCRIDKLEGRNQVGCESCHGPGSLHADKPSAQNIGLGNRPQDCVGCHDRENSPHFEFNRYLAEILGPGHGQPLATNK